MIEYFNDLGRKTIILFAYAGVVIVAYVLGYITGVVSTINSL